MFAIRVHEHGGPEALVGEEVPDPLAGPGEVVVAVEAVGVNFIDVYQRSGLYPVERPFVLGQEAAGTVESVGDGVTEVAVGDRVAWAGPMGAYAQRCALPAEKAVRVPDGVAPEVAAAAMLQGMTAHYLVTDTFPLAAGHRCLVHAAAGGVGLLLVQLAKAAGAEVFATVGSPAKAELARAAGADHVLPYADDDGRDFGALVEDVAGPRPLDVVYDGVGAATFDTGLGLLRRRGTMVTFGNASGPVDPVPPLRLSQGGSLHLTRPVLGDYTATREELVARAGAVLGAVAAGRLDVRVGARFPLAEAADAHRLLEGRGTTGKVLLLPG